MESHFRSDTFGFYSVWRGVTLLVCVATVGTSNLIIDPVYTLDTYAG